MKKWKITINGKTYSYVRNYKKEYTDRTKEQKDNRVIRDQARRKMIKKYGESALKGKDVDHKRGIRAGNGPSNLRVTSVKFNRSRKSLRWR